MYASRALKHLPSLLKISDFSLIPASITEDLLTKDSDYSFYFVNDYSDLRSLEIRNIAILLLFNRPSWSSSMGLVFIPRDDIEKTIKPMIEDAPGVLGTIHLNLPKLVFSEVNALLGLLFKNRSNSHQFTFDELSRFFLSLTDEDWSSLFSIIPDPKKRKNKALEIRNALFRDSEHQPPRFIKDIIK